MFNKKVEKKTKIFMSVLALATVLFNYIPNGPKLPPIEKLNNVEQTNNV